MGFILVSGFHVSHKQFVSMFLNSSISNSEFYSSPWYWAGLNVLYYEMANSLINLVLLSLIEAEECTYCSVLERCSLCSGFFFVYIFINWTGSMTSDLLNSWKMICFSEHVFGKMYYLAPYPRQNCEEPESSIRIAVVILELGFSVLIQSLRT